MSVLALGVVLFGSVTDAMTSCAILDRCVETGGGFIDPSDNCALWADGGRADKARNCSGGRR
ncbi:hypothetical protein ACWD46_06360 [Streptomyces sp. NPDC002486]